MAQELNTPPSNEGIPLSDEQSKRLEEYFQLDPNPKQERYKIMALCLGMAMEQVQFWFQAKNQERKVLKQSRIRLVVKAKGLTNSGSAQTQRDQDRVKIQIRAQNSDPQSGLKAQPGQKAGIEQAEEKNRAQSHGHEAQAENHSLNPIMFALYQAQVQAHEKADAQRQAQPVDEAEFSNGVLYLDKAQAPTQTQAQIDEAQKKQDYMNYLTHGTFPYKPSNEAEAKAQPVDPKDQAQPIEGAQKQTQDQARNQAYTYKINPNLVISVAYSDQIPILTHLLSNPPSQAHDSSDQARSSLGSEQLQTQPSGQAPKPGQKRVMVLEDLPSQEIYPLDSKIQKLQDHVDAQDQVIQDIKSQNSGLKVQVEDLKAQKKAQILAQKLAKLDYEAQIERLQAQLQQAKKSQATMEDELGELKSAETGRKVKKLTKKVEEWEIVDKDELEEFE